MDLGLAGRVCVITGAGAGIGLETARLLRGEEAKVLLVGRDPVALADAAEGLDGGEEEVATLPLDLTEPDAGEQMLGAALEEFEGIDVLVNDAGAAPRRAAVGVPDDDWRDQFELHVMAPLRAMGAIAPVLAERGWGRIVNVCPSAAGRGAAAVRGRSVATAVPGRSVATAAELALSRLFADRFVKDGVLVNAVCPDPEAGAGAVAASIAFLCSRRASYVSGAAWPVDAGTARVV